MKSLLFVVFIAAVVACVFAARCPHGDVSQCSGLVCQNNATEEVGCEHDVCTCVQKPMSCLDIQDCQAVTCEKHDERPHCLDGACNCMKEHHP